MSKFLQSRPNLNAVLDGSLALYGATIGAADLTPGFPVRADASRRLYSTTIGINDITGLKGDLDNLAAKTQNMNAAATIPGDTHFIGGVVSTARFEALGYSMVEIGLTPPAQVGRGIIYADTSDRLHFTTTNGGDTVIASGGPYLPLGGGSMTGPIIMGANAITGSGANTAGSYYASSATSSSSPTTGAIVTTGGLGVAGNTNIGGTLSAGATSLSGVLAMGLNNITSSGLLAGPTWTRTVDNIASIPGVQTYGNITMMSTNTKTLEDSGVSSFSVVIGPASAVTGNLASYNGTTGKVILDSGVLASSIVTGPASSVNNQITMFNGTTGKIIQVGTAAIGTLGALTLANTTASSSVTTGTIICAGGAGIAGKAFLGDNTVIGANQTIAYESKLTLRGTASSTAGPHYTAYTAADQFPVFQNLNFAHGTCALSFDHYWDGAWKSASAASNYQIYKISDQLQFNYGSGVAAGTAQSLATAGFINTSGSLIWQKPVTINDTCTAQRFVSTVPRVLTIASTFTGSISYTAATAQLVNLNTFTSLLNPSGEFTFNNTTGQVTYTGATTQLFRIEIVISEQDSTVSTSMQHWISQNGSLTSVAPQLRFFGGTNTYVIYSVVTVRYLATGNTIQLAGQCSATASVFIQTSQIIITPVN